MTLKRIDRKAFLASTVAAVSAVTLGSCSGESDVDGPNQTGGTSPGGTATGGTATGGTATGGTATGGTATGGAGGLAAGGTATGGSGGALGGSPPGPPGGSGGAAGSAGMMTSGGTGGDGGGGGGTYVCTAETNNGDHSHPLTIPSSHIERGYGDKGVPYVLEDGGTGHTHTVSLSPYEYVYLAGGTSIEEESSSTNGHTHNCVVSCVR
jgi:hypothetical protein